MGDLQKKLKSTNLKLFILLIIIVTVFILFIALYTKSYFSYYSELYSYRQRLIKSLSTENVEKPVFNNTDPYIGNPNARIVIFEFADLSCEACKALQPVIKELRSFYGDNNVMIIWKDLPVTVAPNNLIAHESVHCANDQNKFIEYKDELYKNQKSFTEDLFKGIAKDINLDTEVFNECLDSKKYKDIVSSNFSNALSLGITAAPTIFINNKEVESGFSFQNLRAIIESTK